MTTLRKITRSIARPIFRALPARLQMQLRRPQGPTGVAKAFSDAGIEVTQQDFNHLLHHLRGEELSRLPQQAPCFISVGCAGTWYFEWVQEKCAPLKHIGIEYYSPRPADLPENVEWIANTAGDMSSIPSGTGDILFSGQNIEHLWPHDIGAFLLESYRVLKPGGILVVDSPNRLITSAQNWSHPEHILEFSPDEAVELITAAGFNIEERRGMWLCADSKSGTSLSFSHLTPDKPWSMASRIQEAIAAPNDSFSWWIVARKTDAPPDSVRISGLVKKAFSVAWPERTGRMLTGVGQPVTIDGAQWLRSQGTPGALMFGPYMPLPKGSYTVGFDLRAVARDDSAPLASVDVMDGREEILASRTLHARELAGQTRVELDFELGDTTFGLQYRVVNLTGAELECKRGVSLLSRSDETYSAR